MQNNCIKHPLLSNILNLILTQILFQHLLHLLRQFNQQHQRINLIIN